MYRLRGHAFAETGSEIAKLSRGEWQTRSAAQVFEKKVLMAAIEPDCHILCALKLVFSPTDIDS